MDRICRRPHQRLTIETNHTTTEKVYLSSPFFFFPVPEKVRIQWRHFCTSKTPTKSSCSFSDVQKNKKGARAAATVYKSRFLSESFIVTRSTGKKNRRTPWRRQRRVGTTWQQNKKNTRETGNVSAVNAAAGRQSRQTPDDSSHLLLINVRLSMEIINNEADSVEKRAQSFDLNFIFLHVPKRGGPRFPWLEITKTVTFSSSDLQDEIFRGLFPCQVQKHVAKHKVHVTYEGGRVQPCKLLAAKLAGR